MLKNTFSIQKICLLTNKFLKKKKKNREKTDNFQKLQLVCKNYNFYFSNLQFNFLNFV